MLLRHVGRRAAVSKPLLDDLRKLCERIDTLSRRQFLLHPSKCRCLLRSYGLVQCLLTDVASCSSSAAEGKLDPLLRELLHALHEGEWFLQSCSFQRGPMDRIFPCRLASRRQQWLITEALPVALSTEILDVHLHNFLMCIFPLTRMIARSIPNWDGFGFGRVLRQRNEILVMLQGIVASAEDAKRMQDVEVLLQEMLASAFDEKDAKSMQEAPEIQEQVSNVQALLQEIWASADDEKDAKSMQEVFYSFKAPELKQVCRLICARLSERTSKAQLSLAPGAVPTNLWMDPPRFDRKTRQVHAFTNNRPTVHKLEWKGGQFACKRFRGSASEEEFTSEAVIQASLRHANVVLVLWCTKRAESHFLAMELMDESLGHLIEKRRAAGIDPPFSLLAGIDIMLQVAKGMEYLHSLGIVHRDLKASNILVRHQQCMDDADRLIVKLADFGLAKVNNTTSLLTTKRVGTSRWRAPEVVDSEDERMYTEKADVYSFAIVCSQILVGLHPDEHLQRGQMSELLCRVVGEGTRPPLPSSCPPAIASCIRECWDGEASKRPTFRGICRSLRYFKVCLLSREIEVLSCSDPCMVNLQEGDLERLEADTEQRYPHPLLGVPSDMDSVLDLVSKRR